ncbi:MAG TPA: MurR/RpiR family transcriptional regulator [Stellaceae bacterium]|nr:MurR/RpiR family transcriptional regulator [Stellaceae bacterium]
MDRRPATFEERLAAHFATLSPLEQRVARHFADQPEDAMFCSALDIAEAVGTSDATVIRTAKALGYKGLPELRREFTERQRSVPTPAARLRRTLDELDADGESALDLVIETQFEALERLRRNLAAADFDRAVARIAGARRVFIFGIGPSSGIAQYFALQLSRVGCDTAAVTETGISLADSLRRFRSGDVVILMAYIRAYPEVTAVIAQAKRLALPVILISDSLGELLRNDVDTVLPASRGRAGMIAMHATTVVLIEALVVGVARRDPRRAIAELGALNELRAGLAGERIDVGRADYEAHSS